MNPQLLLGVLALALACAGSASPAQARRLYDAQRFAEAEQQYQRLLERKPGDAPLEFNAGTAACQARQYETAASHLEAALAAPDPALRQRAYYNLGHAWYRLGEAAGRPDQTTAAWEKALAAFTRATDLDSQDADARFNRDFVQKKLEELKKQSSESKPDNSKQDKSDKSDRSDRSDQSDKSAKSEDGSQAGTNAPATPPPQENTEPSGKTNQTPRASPPTGSPNPTNAPGSDVQKAEGDSGEDQPVAPGQMTRQQARQLLDAQRAEERALILTTNLPARNRPFKNW